MVYITKLLITRKHTYEVEISRLGEVMWYSLQQYPVLYSLYIYIASSL